MTRHRTTYANVTATLALVAALGSGGAYAANLAKNSVGSPQVKNGTIKGVDVRDHGLTGADVRDDGLTGTDIDESTLRLPAVPQVPQPAVFASPMTDVPIDMTGQFVDVATFTYTAPADGYVLVHASASIHARGTGSMWCLLTHDTTDAAAIYWDTGDVDSAFDLRQTAEGVVAVTKGQHTVSLALKEHQPRPAGSPPPTWSQVIRPKIIVEFFPTGSVV